MQCARFTPIPRASKAPAPEEQSRDTIPAMQRLQVSHRGFLVGLSLLLALVGGCESDGSRPSFWERRGLIGELGQPRLIQILEHLERNGFPKATKATIYQVSHWAMYREGSWDDEPLKPRFEVAEIEHEGERMIVTTAVVPVWHSEKGETEKIVPSFSQETGEQNGAGVVANGRRWMIGFTLAKPDAKRVERVTALLVEFTRTHVGAGPTTR
jgi:hypothetical protein